MRQLCAPMRSFETLGMDPESCRLSILPGMKRTDQAFLINKNAMAAAARTRQPQVKDPVERRQRQRAGNTLINAYF